MAEKKQNENLENEFEISKPETETHSSEKQYSLNDDRRVKVLSPGAMVAKRFIRNRIAVVGLAILIAMFVFSFIGGLITPYKENQQFYTTKYLKKEYAAAIQSVDFRYKSADGQDFGSLMQAKFILAEKKAKADGSATFNLKGNDYTVYYEGENLYSVYLGDTIIGIAYKDIFNVNNAEHSLSFNTLFAGLKAYTNGESAFSGDPTVGALYHIDEYGVVYFGGEEFGFISDYVVTSYHPDVFLTKEFKEFAVETIESNPGVNEITARITGEDGAEVEYLFEKNPNNGKWSIKQDTPSRVYDTYASPSWEHWLGTDGNGMDMLTRLMYGGRVSLMIGFIVEIIATTIGVILGGISGYFGGWVDNLIMRIVDVFYCIPSLPILIILGVAMDNLGVKPQVRMIYLMLILGILGWPGLARLVRGQILSLREQEFMTATEACGIRASRRIFRHLIPNVIPQLIVSCTMGLGGTILTEATLSFLGLGVRFPFASWGNIINDVNNTFVLTTYWFIWIPAGALLLLTVLAFNILGDGLRDAFDPKMKR